MLALSLLGVWNEVEFHADPKGVCLSKEEAFSLFLSREGQTTCEGGAESHGSVEGQHARQRIETDSRVAEVKRRLGFVHV